MAVQFDGEALEIVLESGVTNISWATVYSDWKRWQLDRQPGQKGNRGYPQAFRTVAGDPVGSINVSPVFFLQNQYGWRLRPPEETITITAEGVLSLEDQTLPGILPTVGGHTVLILPANATVVGIETLVALIKKTLTLAQWLGLK